MEINFKQNYFFWLVIGLVLLIDIPLVIWMQKSLASGNNQKESLHKIMPLGEELRLDRKQENLFNRLISEYYSSADSIDRFIDSINGQIVKRIFDKNYNKDKVISLIESGGGLNIREGMLRADYLRKLTGLLDIKQQEKFKKIVKESFAERSDTLTYDKTRVTLPHPRRIF
ncbi:MAG TPA: hypothetical protein VMT35_09385 [Ignavibacteriaceae bacterium]|nr:hypothetical protein [Ignavibacteriaceae bacterium]